MSNYTIEKNVFLHEGYYCNQDIIENLRAKIKNLCLSNPLKADNSLKNAIMTNWDAFVDDKDFHIFLKEIKEDFLKINLKAFNVFDAWGGWYRKGSEAYCEKHDHLGANLCCGVLYLSDHGPGTHFPEINKTVQEKVGKFVLFHPILDHEVKKHIFQDDRYIIAFNMRKLRKGEDY